MGVVVSLPGYSLAFLEITLSSACPEDMYCGVSLREKRRHMTDTPLDKTQTPCSLRVCLSSMQPEKKTPNPSDRHN
jgi:hypothetical protein